MLYRPKSLFLSHLLDKKFVGGRRRVTFEDQFYHARLKGYFFSAQWSYNFALLAYLPSCYFCSNAILRSAVVFLESFSNEFH